MWVIFARLWQGSLYPATLFRTNIKISFLQTWSAYGTSFAVSNSKTIRRKHFFRRYIDENWLKRGLWFLNLPKWDRRPRKLVALVSYHHWEKKEGYLNDFLGPISSRLATRRENFGTLSSKYKLMIRKLMNCTPLSKDSDRDVFCNR